MSHSKLNQSWSTITRRAIVDGVKADRHAARRPVAGRVPGKFPLTITIGLMTVGVIVAISTLQVVTALFG